MRKDNLGIWAAFVCSKMVYMLLAIFVYARFTSLGDTNRYLNSERAAGEFIHLKASALMDIVASSIASLIGPVLANIPFVLLSSYGIYFSLTRLKLSREQLVFVLLILSLPSFGIWSSVASKEAVGVFYMGILVGTIIDVIEGNRIRVGLTLLAIFLCAVFKPQYLIGYAASVVFVLTVRVGALRAGLQIGVIFCFFACSALALYLAREPISAYSLVMESHFAMTGSTRDNDIWIEPNDVFFNAPYGMIIAFVGPTLTEALEKPTHFAAFMESAVIVFIFIYSSARLLGQSLRTGFVNVFYAGLFLTASLWILFVAYPTGALNPGSAVRYRTNFFGFLVVLHYYCYLNSYRSMEHFFRSRLAGRS